MKKALSLFLAALLVLTSVVALAAAPSPDASFRIIKTEGGEMVVVTNPTIDEQINKTIDALAALPNVMDAFDAEAQDALKAVFGDAPVTVSEIAAVAVEKIDDDAESLKVDCAVLTPYKVGDKVACLFEVHPDLTNYEQFAVNAEVTGEGEFTITVSKADAQKIADALYSVILVVGEK